MELLEQFLQAIHPSKVRGALVYAGLFAILGVLGTIAIRGAVRTALRRDMADRTALMFLRPLAQVFLWMFIVVAYAHLIPSLRSLGTALLAGASVASIVLGLAAQNTLGSLIAGLALLVYRPFRAGDRIQVMAPTGVETGIVESVTLGYTVLQTYDNRRVVVPNSLAASQTTVNLTSVDAKILAAVPIGIAYDADVDRARSILMEITRRHPEVVEAVGCPVIQLGASSVTLSVRAWCKDMTAARTFEWDVYETAKAEFQKAGIEIPFPYQNVIVKSEEKAVTTSRPQSAGQPPDRP